MGRLQRGAPAVYQLFHLGGYYYAIVMAAKIRQHPDRFQRVLRKDKDSALQPLEAAKDLQYVFSVVSHRHRLAVRRDVLELLNNLPIAGIHYAAAALGRFR